MSYDESYSPAPWKWTDFGVLSDAEGVAVIDLEDWNLSPENAVMIQRAPELYQCLRQIRNNYADVLPADEMKRIDDVLSLSSKITK